MKDYTQRRHRMVESHILQEKIQDRRVLAAMMKVPRDRFVPEALADRAYENCALPIGEGQTISQPYVVACTVAALELTGQEKILEIGVGSGYQAAILAECGRKVYGIERIGSLTQRAQKVLEELGVLNVVLRTGDGTYGWQEYGPYHAIAVAAAGPEVPPPLLKQLALGGRMVIPVGDRNGQVLRRICRTTNGFETEELDLVQFVPLVGRYGMMHDGESPKQGRG